MASSHSSTILDIDLPTYKARVGDRVYTASVFADVYLKTGNSIGIQSLPSEVSSASKLHLTPYITNNFTPKTDMLILEVIEEKILKQTADFHGPCSIHEEDSSCITNRGLVDERQQELSLNTISPLTAVREGFRISACVEISKIDSAIKNFTFNITGNETEVFDYKQHTDAVYDLFYPAQSMSNDAYNAIVDMVTSMVSNGEKNIDIWRNVSLAICKTPGWQIP